MAREDWTLKSEGDEFVWTVERTWLRDLTVTSVGTPALFFSTPPDQQQPFHDPAQLGRHDVLDRAGETAWLAQSVLPPGRVWFWIQAGVGEQRRRHRAGRLGRAETLSRVAARVRAAVCRRGRAPLPARAFRLVERGGHRVVARGKADLPSRRQGKDDAADCRRPGRRDGTPTGRAGGRSKRHGRRRCAASTARCSTAAASTTRSTTTSATSRTAGTTAARRG